MKSGKSNIEIVQDYLDGVRPFVQVGYTGKKYVKRKVGERWTDAKGIDWEQKESGPSRVNRVADIVRAAREMKCKCGQNIKWGTRSDNHFFMKTGMCESCLIDYETKLRILGIYDTYEQYKLISNECGYLKDIQDKLSDTVKFFTENSGDIEMLCNSEGFIERWKCTDKEVILADAKKDLALVEERLKNLLVKKEEFKKNYAEAAGKYNLEVYGR